MALCCTVQYSTMYWLESIAKDAESAWETYPMIRSSTQLAVSHAPAKSAGLKLPTKFGSFLAEPCMIAPFN